METLGQAVLDLLLGSSLLALAWGSLTSKDLHRAVVLFIGFGLLLALVWVRLRAPDIALAEAAIGAGLTGALLLSALQRRAGRCRLPRRRLGADRLCCSQSLAGGLTLVIGVAFVHGSRTGRSGATGRSGVRQAPRAG